jgi:hypothetical protein
MDETWLSRDLRVLDAVVELLEDQDLVQPDAVAARTGLDSREILRAGLVVPSDVTLGGCFAPSAMRTPVGGFG